MTQRSSIPAAGKSFCAEAIGAPKSTKKQSNNQSETNRRSKLKLHKYTKMYTSDWGKCEFSNPILMRCGRLKWKSEAEEVLRSTQRSEYFRDLKKIERERDPRSLRLLWRFHNPIELLTIVKNEFWRVYSFYILYICIYIFK